MTTIRVDGVKQTIAELNKVDPALRKKFNANVREITRPLVNAAQAKYRATNFPSGTTRNWAQKGRPIFPLDPARAARGVRPQISTSRRQASTIVVVQSNAGASVFEFAANGPLGQAFGTKNGPTPRVMWPAADATKNIVEAQMARLVEDTTNDINKRLY